MGTIAAGSPAAVPSPLAINHRAINHRAINHWAINHWAVGRGIRLSAGRFQRHPGPGQVQAAADLAGQVAQQLGRAGDPGQALAEAAEAGVARQPCPEYPAIGEVLQTGPNGLARCPRGHGDCHREGGRRGQAGQHADQDRQEGEHDADRNPQDTVDETAPRGLVDAEYPGVEQSPEHRPQRGDLRQSGQQSGRHAGRRAVRVGQLPQHARRDPQAERRRDAEQQPANLPALCPVGTPVTQREQRHADHRPGRIGPVHGLGGTAQRRQGRHVEGPVQDRRQVAGRTAVRGDVGQAGRLEQREQEAGQGHRPDDGALVGAFGPAGREQADQADAGDRGGRAAH